MIDQLSTLWNTFDCRKTSSFYSACNVVAVSNMVTVLTLRDIVTNMVSSSKSAQLENWVKTCSFTVGI